MICTFFGHKDSPENIKDDIREIIINLITEKNVKTFYVGNHGNFDVMVRNILTELVEIYDIEFFIILAYLPKEEQDYSSNTIFPDGIENTPKRFAITYRNKWMIEKSDYVVTYVTHSWGGATQFKELAEKKGKNVINIGDNINYEIRLNNAINILIDEIKIGENPVALPKEFILEEDIYVEFDCDI